MSKAHGRQAWMSFEESHNLFLSSKSAEYHFVVLVFMVKYVIFANKIGVDINKDCIFIFYVV